MDAPSRGAAIVAMPPDSQLALYVYSRLEVHPPQYIIGPQLAPNGTRLFPALLAKLRAAQGPGELSILFELARDMLCSDQSLSSDPNIAVPLSRAIEQAAGRLDRGDSIAYAVSRALTRGCG